MSNPLPTQPDSNSTDGTGISPLTWSQVLDKEDRALLGADDRAEATPAPGSSPDDEDSRLREVIARLHQPRPRRAVPVGRRRAQRARSRSASSRGSPTSGSSIDSTTCRPCPVAATSVAGSPPGCVARACRRCWRASIRSGPAPREDDAEPGRARARHLPVPGAAGRAASRLTSGRCWPRRGGT